jgi:hypothetical protein
MYANTYGMILPINNSQTEKVHGMLYPVNDGNTQEDAPEFSVFLAKANTKGQEYAKLLNAIRDKKFMEVMSMTEELPDNEYKFLGASCCIIMEELCNSCEHVHGNLIREAMSDLAFKIKQTLPPRDTTFTQEETRQECLTFRKLVSSETGFFMQIYRITQKEMYQECPDFWKAIDARNYKEAVAIAEQRGLASEYRTIANRYLEGEEVDYFGTKNYIDKIFKVSVPSELEGPYYNTELKEPFREKARAIYDDLCKSTDEEIRQAWSEWASEFWYRLALDRNRSALERDATRRDLYTFDLWLVSSKLFRKNRNYDLHIVPLPPCHRGGRH